MVCASFTRDILIVEYVSDFCCQIDLIYYREKRKKERKPCHYLQLSLKENTHGFFIIKCVFIWSCLILDKGAKSQWAGDARCVVWGTAAGDTANAIPHK